jgi:hypothetical protein
VALACALHFSIQAGRQQCRTRNHFRRKKEKLADTDKTRRLRKDESALLHRFGTPATQITTTTTTLLHKSSKRPTPVPQQGFFLPRRQRSPRPSFTSASALRLTGQPHFESPQFRQVMQPSIMTTAAVLHLLHSWAPSGKWDLEKASVCLVRASNSARFASTSFCWCSSS